MTPQPGEALRQIRNLCAERHPHTPDETVAWLAVHELLRQMESAPVAGEGLDHARVHEAIERSLQESGYAYSPRLSRAAHAAASSALAANQPAEERT